MNSWERIVSKRLKYLERKEREEASEILVVLHLMGSTLEILKPEESRLKKASLDFEESKVMIISNLAQIEVGTKTSRANDSITFKDIHFLISLVKLIGLRPSSLDQ